MSLQLLCFFASALLYGAVSSKLYQEVAAMQVQTLVSKIQEGEWIVLQMAVFVSGNEPLALEMSRMAICATFSASILFASSSNKPTLFLLGERLISSSVFNEDTDL